MALKDSSWRTFPLRLAAVTLLALPMGIAGVALADEINSGGLPTKNVIIEKVETGVMIAEVKGEKVFGDRLIYKMQSGAPGEKIINDKLRITLNDEPNLTIAEDAFANGKWSDAVDAFQKTHRATSKPWLKDYSAIRLLKAGEKSDRFDAVVTAYIYLLANDPKVSQQIRLKYPEDPANAYLKTAASQVDAALAAEKDATRQTSLTVFRMNIAKAMHDETMVLKLAGDLSKTTPADGSAGAIDPTVLAGITDGKLNLIQSSIEKKDFASALKGLEQVKPAVSEPKHQSEWLWLTAETSSGVAGDTKDPATLRNVAIDYMRLVANFPSGPHTGQALLKTAGILEKLTDTKAALAVYQQVARDFGDQPAGSQARKDLARLGGK